MISTTSTNTLLPPISLLSSDATPPHTMPRIAQPQGKRKKYASPSTMTREKTPEVKPFPLAPHYTATNVKYFQKPEVERNNVTAEYIPIRSSISGYDQ